MDAVVTGQDESVLIIDHQSEVFESGEAFIRGAGYKVLHREGADAGLEAVTAEWPDAVVLDLGLPVADILAYIEKLLDVNPMLPIVVACDYHQEQLTVEALTIGASYFVLKPLREQGLIFSLHSCFQKAKLIRENEMYRYKMDAANRELKRHLDELEADQKTGGRVQRRMLPPSPHEILGFQFEHIVFPASYMSGDFLNYHQVSDDKVVFFLVDVTGHGSASALVTVLVNQMAVRSRRHFELKHQTEIKTAAWMLGWINSTLLNVGMDRHLTAFMGVLDKTNMRLNYSYGGHYPPAILTNKGESNFLAGRGLPVGLVKDAEFEDVYIDLEPDFSLTVMSDGVLEIMQQKDLVEKEKRLLSLTAKEHTIQTLVDNLKVRSLEALDDDVSILTLRPAK